MFDAIVVGSGISGGWAAKELTEGGARVLMIERGRNVRHGEDYTYEHVPPWEMPFRGLGDRRRIERDYPVQSRSRSFDEASAQFYANDRDHPYQVEPGSAFSWLRGQQTGGRSLIWGRVAMRLSELNFSENRLDGHGVDWPIRYADIARWYDYVERFIGVSGNRDGIDSLPDGVFLPPFAMNCIEEHASKAIKANFPDRRLIHARTAVLSEDHGGRAKCHFCGPCHHGCSTGSFFSTQSSTLPAAEATGRLTLLNDTIVAGIDYDPKSKRATGVRTIDSKTGERRTFTARLIFVNASTLGTLHVLLNSVSEAFPRGLANSSGVLGHGIMDTMKGPVVTGTFDGYDGFQPVGNRPAGIYIPRFRNVGAKDADFLRGYGFQGGASRALWTRGVDLPLFGAELKRALRKPGPWQLMLAGMAEPLPNPRNQVSLDPKQTDKWGLPQLRVRHTWSDNERRMVDDILAEGEAMLRSAGAVRIDKINEIKPGGETNHEMGGAPMGHDPAGSVLNRFNQTHDVPNLFVTDGACMSSSPCQNPSLTYMALTARAADYALTRMKQGAL
ncbi:GMC oxidoreductase [Sphingomonas flavalba]|uniref:GMC oxidoreductase n=1 Tax=Sphingomonas flavalba TaxID=2559804 RepID=UPI0039E118B3